MVQSAFAGVDADRAVYVGGTASVQQGTQSALDASDDKVVKFGGWQLP
jgi:hypothetical protein